MAEGRENLHDASLAKAIAGWGQQHLAKPGPVPVLAISGAQGIGKTTAIQQFRAMPEVNVAVLSLDDFYLPKQDRHLLAKSVHPLCATRGAPGTHDIPLLTQTIETLKAASSRSKVCWPVFDKRTDDRAPEQSEQSEQSEQTEQSGRSDRSGQPDLSANSFAGAPDAILIEGWMMGALPDPSAASANPINDLEAEEDLQGVWRAWQERSLEDSYLPLWQDIDAFLHVLAPGFGTVLDWRCEQEETTLGLAKGSLPPDRRAWVSRFIQHYERITRRMLAGEHVEGTCLQVDADRQLTISNL